MDIIRVSEQEFAGVVLNNSLVLRRRNFLGIFDQIVTSMIYNIFIASLEYIQYIDVFQEFAVKKLLIN